MTGKETEVREILGYDTEYQMIDDGVNPYWLFELKSADGTVAYFTNASNVKYCVQKKLIKNKLKLV